MKTSNNSEADSTIFLKLFEDPMKLVSTRKMVSKIRDKKREIKTLFLQTIGKFKEKKKPYALTQFEEGYRKYLFGENGVLTKKLPDLQQEYLRNRSQKSIFSPKRIKTGDLTYWNSNLASNRLLNGLNTAKMNHLRRSAFFLIDNHEVDLYHSHMPTINHRYLSSKSERNITTQEAKTKPLVTVKPSPSIVSIFQSKPTSPKAFTSPKGNKKSTAISPKDVLTKLTFLDSKQNIIDKRLYKIIARTKTNHCSAADKGKIKEGQLEDMEAVYDVKTQHQTRLKKKTLFEEAKKRQRQVTTTQAVMIRLTDMIGVINDETAKKCAENIYLEYENLLNLHDSDLFKHQPKLVFTSKNNLKNNKRLKLELNSQRMRKMEYNITRIKNNALVHLANFKSEGDI